MRINKSKILILGAGPAGTSCAISLLKAGFKNVTIIDKQNFPRHTPGETLHPGIEPLLKQLGVFDDVQSSNFIRHQGIENIRNGIFTYEAYNKDLNWRGFQLIREEFDILLLVKAIQLGVNFQGNVTPIKINQCMGQITSVETITHRFEADYFIDATGSRAWLAKKYKIEFEEHSPKKIAYYGYVENSNFSLPNPKLVWDKIGWTWFSRIKENLTAWVRLDIKKHKKINKEWVPECLTDGKSTGPRKAVDVTWRIAKACCKENCFLVGDAAFVLDPSSSHGVLKAIMSGIMVSHIMSNYPISIIQNQYNEWMNEQFNSDISKLNVMYKDFELNT